MKQILLSFLSVSLLFSCEIQRANGPKVSEESLIDELVTLGMFGTVEPMRALSIILAGASEEIMISAHFLILRPILGISSANGGKAVRIGNGW